MTTIKDHRIVYYGRIPPEPSTEGETAEAQPPLLFLHGALGSLAEFDHIVHTFKDRDCILVDLPAHGRSLPLSSLATTNSFASAILDLLNVNGIHSVDIIGYSLGSYVGIEMALQSPTQVRSIISHAMKFYWTDGAIDQAVA